jgi:hypothetical protein
MKRIANHVLLESITTKWVRTVKPSVKHAQQDTHNLLQEKHFVCRVHLEDTMKWEFSALIVPLVEHHPRQLEIVHVMLASKAGINQAKVPRPV